VYNMMVMGQQSLKGYIFSVICKLQNCVASQ
jgi:hypothetical protein